jgi:hypothetical protein
VPRALATIARFGGRVIAGGGNRVGGRGVRQSRGCIRERRPTSYPA